MPGSAPRSNAISPTAHYTATVWARHGLSDPALVTPTGQLLFGALRAPMALSKALGGPTLEGYLIARHRLIDRLLEEAIRERGVSQVIEIACGMSPRGLRFSRSFGDRITYIEADLPDMATLKQRALERTGSLGAHHRVVEVDALSEDGPRSVASLAEALDTERGTAVITEGLLSYLDRGSVDGLWRRIAGALRRFTDGLYLSDLHISSEGRGPVADVFMLALSAFVRGRVRVHFDRPDDALAAARAAGFAHAALRRPVELADQARRGVRDASVVRVLEATL
jgi:O-methyltransferase involved in polyketide biosynthesis